ncbi:hypothetical protein SUGI_1014660 [Cryptomeria japonica]|nr:hypothetical protein SUGI_1014660 [Cryptomeria japonica]
MPDQSVDWSTALNGLMAISYCGLTLVLGKCLMQMGEDGFTIAALIFRIADANSFISDSPVFDFSHPASIPNS